MTGRAVRVPKSLLLGTDFSAASEAALSRAIQIATRHGATLHVVHVAPRLPRALVRKFALPDDGKLRAQLDAVVERVRQAGVRGRGHFAQGDPIEALTVKARALAADLVIVGSQGRSLRNAVLGSTAERLSAYDRHRVLLVRKASSRPYRRVLIAADEGSDLQAQAASATLFSDARPTVLHAYEAAFEPALVLHGASVGVLSSYRAEARRDAEALMTKRLEQAGLGDAQLLLRHGNAQRVLLRVSADSLLVLSRGHSALRRMVLGSVTRIVIANGACDVLLV